MSLEMAIWLFVIGVPGLIMLLTGRPLINPSLLRLINPGRHRLLARCCGALLLCACGCMISRKCRVVTANWASGCCC